MRAFRLAKQRAERVDFGARQSARHFAAQLPGGGLDRLQQPPCLRCEEHCIAPPIAYHCGPRDEAVALHSVDQADRRRRADVE